MGGTVRANEQCPTTTFIAAAQPPAARTSRGEDWRGDGSANSARVAWEGRHEGREYSMICYYPHMPTQLKWREQLTSKLNCSTTRSLQQLPVDSEANFSRSITSMLGCKTINSKSYLAILYMILKKTLSNKMPQWMPKPCQKAHPLQASSMFEATIFDILKYTERLLPLLVQQWTNECR